MFLNVITFLQGLTNPYFFAKINVSENKLTINIPITFPLLLSDQTLITRRSTAVPNRVKKFTHRSTARYSVRSRRYLTEVPVVRH